MPPETTLGDASSLLARVFDDLIRFETELWNAVDERLRSDCGLPLSWYEPMEVVARVPGCRVNDIAERLSITVGGTSKLVDRIEAAGHCRRHPNPGDRRSSVVELTPGGRLLLTGATRAFEDELSVRLGAALSPRGLDQFGRTLARLRSSSRAGSEQQPA